MVWSPLKADDGKGDWTGFCMIFKKKMVTRIELKDVQNEKIEEKKHQ